MRIEICGGIASGKTSLTKLLEKNNFGIAIYEKFQDNPFWKSFYENPGKYIFETELTFTLQHYHEIKKYKDNELIVCDYSLLLDFAYANIGLDAKKLEIYNNVLQEIYNDISKADLYIFLKCSAEEELHRIKHRNRKTEKNIQIDFLTQLNEELYKNISTKKTSDIIVINSEKYDFVNNDSDKKKVISKIKNYYKQIHNKT